MQKAFPGVLQLTAEDNISEGKSRGSKVHTHAKELLTCGHTWGTPRPPLVTL